MLQRALIKYQFINNISGKELFATINIKTFQVFKFFVVYCCYHDLFRFSLQVSKRQSNICDRSLTKRDHSIDIRDRALTKRDLSFDIRDRALTKEIVPSTVVAECFAFAGFELLFFNILKMLSKLTVQQFKQCA